MIRDEAVPAATEVGRWWKRDNSVEVDIVIGDRAPVAHAISAIGSIKWHHNAPFDFAEASALHHARSVVPGTHPGTVTIAASRTPVETTGIDLVYRPSDLLDVWD